MDQSLASPNQEIVYSLSRLQWMSGWWTWAIAIGLLGLVLYLMVRLYRRDTVELAPATRWTLIVLRTAVVLGLVFFFLGLERRARQKVVRPSEVVVLVDTSQSMSLPQGDEPGGLNRIEAAKNLVADSPLLEQFGQQHRVSVYSFDATGELNELVVAQAKQGSGDETEDNVAATDQRNEQTAGADAALSWTAIAGAAILLLALVAMLVATAMQVFAGASAAPIVLFGSTILLLIGGCLLGSEWTIHADRPLLALLGGTAEEVVTDQQQPSQSTESTDGSEETLQSRLAQVDWDAALVAAGAESRIGDALRSTLLRHDPSTLTGVLLLTDGQSNSGAPPVSAAALAARGGTAIYPIGFGSAKPPTNVRIVELEAPRRVYPGDKFGINAVLQASGSQPITVQVQLLDKQDDAGSETAPNAEGQPTANAVTDNAGGLGELIDSQEVTIPADGTLSGIRFEVEPQAVGRRRLSLRIVPPADDQNEEDNLRSARYEVVSRRLRVMLMAGGPMLEYRFLRNLLFRDPSVEIDVWLQTGQQGISQDADQILAAFPTTAEELYKYDAIVAFDPDWMRLSAESIALLDKWLSEQAGGLVLVSGPVYLPEWSGFRTDPRVSAVRNFFPVVLPNRGPLLSSGRVGGETIYPLTPAPDFMRADFLVLGDDPEQSAQAWNEFTGVYDHVGTREAKPGAKVYAYFSDQSTAIDGRLPIYFASQFYGAGRVFFQGSGEMWRIRGVSDALFDSYYTKLIRWVSEGRLLRDSNRGVLLVDRPRAQVGDTIAVRAILTDEQFEPLRVPQVEAKLLTPSGRIDTIRLTPVEGEPREGTYGGRFLVREAGSFEVLVTLGDALGEQVLKQSVQVSLPTLELERPQRNDEVLMAVAATTGGKYYPLDAEGISSTTATTNESPLDLATAIEAQPQVTILPGTPDRQFQERRNATLMWLLCAMLTMEWMVRRLNRLA